MSGNFYATTTVPSESVKVVIEADGTGYQLYYISGSTKTYLYVVAKPSTDKTYYNLAYGTTKPSTAWVWDASLGTFTFAVDGNSYFIGTYNSFDTLSACKSTYTTNFKAVFVENATENPGGNEGGDEGGDDNQGGNEGGNEGSGSVVAGALAATFTFGEDDSSKTDESQQVQDGSSITTYTEDSNGYTLTLEDLSKAYAPAYDATGKACLKLGTGKVAGTFTFTVPENVKSVKIYVAGYKSNVGKFTINGGSTQSTTKTSANGEYDVITIDTSSTKTITFATVTGGYRVKINTIEFYN